MTDPAHTPERQQEAEQLLADGCPWCNDGPISDLGEDHVERCGRIHKLIKERRSWHWLTEDWVWALIQKEDEVRSQAARLAAVQELVGSLKEEAADFRKAAVREQCAEYSSIAANLERFKRLLEAALKGEVES